MSYFAELDSNNVVKRVIVADQVFIDSGAVGDPTTWVETSMDGTKSKTYAGIGHTYDPKLKAFIPPKPYESWTLDTDLVGWKPPFEAPALGPTDKARIWNEDRKSWSLIKEDLSVVEISTSEVIKE